VCPLGCDRVAPQFVPPPGAAHASGKSSSGKALAKGDNHGKSTPASNKKKDDAIDKALAQFK